MEQSGRFSQEQITEPKRYMDTGELAEYLGISKWLVYKYIDHRDIPFIPFGRLIRFDKLAIDKWTEKRTVRAAPSRQLERRPQAGNKTLGTIVLPLEPGIAGFQAN